ncbi:MAG: ABC transporter ATP-binding protein [Clostridiales bacterium]|nr:ABC transporter ATP-binding protein [Clostridiales bacterium]
MIQMRDIVKRYTLGGEVINALDHVSMDIKDGEYLSIIGPSGSGKSTLMNIIGCLDLPDEGSYQLNGKEITKYSQRQLARLRGEHIGFIFQGFNLLNRLDAIENVELPLIYQKIGVRERRARAKEALDMVGLGDRLKHRPNQLSGGQQQRVAIARALAARPQLILADEPTGNLDSKTGQDLMKLLRDLNESGKTIVIITHDVHIASQAKRTLRIVDGHIFVEGGAVDAVV